MSLKRTINNERFQRYFKNTSTIVLSKEKSLSTKKVAAREKKKKIQRIVRRFYVIDLLFFILTILYDESCLFISSKKMIMNKCIMR